MTFSQLGKQWGEVFKCHPLFYMSHGLDCIAPPKSVGLF